MADKLVTIARHPNSIEAQVAKQLLSDAGIKAVALGDNTANVYAGLPFLADVKLQVFENQAKRAQEILESDKKQEE